MGDDYFGGSRVPGVWVFHQQLDVSIRPRPAEMERRRALGVRSIGDHDVIKALMTLPEGIAVARADAEVDALLVLEDLVRCGAVDEDGDQVIRRAVPPVELLGLTKTTTRWADVQAITLLRTHAPRLVITSSVRLARRVVREIDPEVGVGLVVGDEIEYLRQPAGSKVRPTWRRWVTAEAAYEAWLPVDFNPVPGAMR